MSHKYGAKRTELDGHSFPSRAEARRYSELKLMQQQGVIEGLLLQPRFPLLVNGVKIGHMTLDFAYRDDNGTMVYEDVKGGNATKTEAYRLRKKLLKACHGIDITEVQ